MKNIYTNLSVKSLFRELIQSPELVSSIGKPKPSTYQKFDSITKKLKDNTTVALFDSQVRIGQAIKVSDNKYFVKIGSNEYIDIADGSKYTAYQIASMTSLSFRIVSKEEVYNKIESLGLLNRGIKHIELDIETSLKIDSHRPDIRDVYQIGLVEYNNISKSITNKINVLNYDILHNGIMQARKLIGKDKSKLANKRIQDQLFNNWKESADMSAKLRKTYLNYIEMFLDNDDELIKHVSGKSGYHLIKGENTTTVIGGPTGIVNYMSEFFDTIAPQINKGDITISSFNPGGLDQIIVDLILELSMKKGKFRLSLGDTRTYTLMLKSLIYGDLSSDFVADNFLLINNVLDKLGVAGVVRQEIIESMYKGPTSSYSPSTSEESLINIIRQAKKFGIKGRYVEAHEGLSDAIDAINLVKQTQSILDEVRSASPVKEMNIKKRLSMAFIKELITDKILNSPAGKEFLDVSDNYYEATNLFYKFFDKATGLEKAKTFVDTQTLAYAGRKMIGNMFGDARFQFDLYKDVMLSDEAAVNAVNSFLIGAFGAGFIKWAIAKADARKKEEILSDPEGLSHNSIPTIIRRLQLSDFGSARSKGNWTTLSYYFIKSTFDEIRSRGLGKSVGNLLSNINKYIKYKMTGNEFKKIMEAKANIRSESKILGKRLFDTIFRKDTETKRNVYNAIKNIYSKSSNVYNKVKNIKFDDIKIREMSESLVNKWKQVPLESRMYISAGLGIGIMSAIFLNSMRGNYDPYYDYRDYIDRDYSLPRNYRKNIRYIKAIRHIHDLSETRYNDNESDQRFALRQQLSDFGSKIQPIIEGMWEKSIYSWGKMRTSLEKAFEFIGNKFRIFKKDANLIINSPIENANIKSNKLKSAVSRSILSSMEQESRDMTTAALSIVNDDNITNRIPVYPKYKRVNVNNISDIKEKIDKRIINSILKRDGNIISIEHAVSPGIDMNIGYSSEYYLSKYKKIMDKSIYTIDNYSKIINNRSNEFTFFIINNQNKSNIDNATHLYTYLNEPKYIRFENRLKDYIASNPTLGQNKNTSVYKSYSDLSNIKIRHTVKDDVVEYPNKVGKLYDKLPKGEVALSKYEKTKYDILDNKSSGLVDTILYTGQLDKKDAAYKSNKYIARLISERMMSTKFGRLHTSYGSFMPYEYKSNIDIDFLPGWH